MKTSALLPAALLLACSNTNSGLAGVGGSGTTVGAGSTDSADSTGSTDSTDSTAGASGSAAEATGGPGGSGETGDPIVPVFDLPALLPVNDGRFATSGACTACHTTDASATAMFDEAGRDVSPYDLWQATMMANSARYPFWWAMVRAETVATPSVADVIEGECTRCHAPMAGARPELWGDTPMRLDLLLTDPERGQLGIDGVACSACHKIGDTDLHGESQWSGHLDLRPEPQIMGPHADPFTNPMMMHTGFTPVQASHLDASAACAGCHTLDTDTLDEDGRATGGHHSEQAPYLEWLNSAYSTEVADPSPQARSCQGCHMPSVSEDGVPISTRIARRPKGGDFPPVSERSPYHRHTFLGGNTLLPAIIRDNADTLRPVATADAFDALIAQTLAQLQTNTAGISLGAPSRRGDILEFTARVENHTGHKFPSAFPSRRAWVELVVTDANGDEVFHSGAVDGHGRMLDPAGGVLATEDLGGSTQPHFDVIDDPAHVQIYEEIMVDAGGNPTFRLLRAAGDYKDNRLLPDGWREDGPFMDRIAPVLGATDADFTGGRDDVTYTIHAPVGAGPYTIEARLLYQTISARFANELFALDAPEIRAFEAMWDEADRTPVVIATSEVSG